MEMVLEHQVLVMLNLKLQNRIYATRPQTTRFEYLKHHNLRVQYADSLKQVLELYISKQDLIHHFPAFIGH